MLDYIKTCLTNKYADFNGRARRSEFWYFFFFCTILQWLVMFGAASIVGETGATLLLVVVVFGLIIPRIAVTWRRMHDVGKSGWYSFIPIYNIILLCTEGHYNENDYGPNPKGLEDATTDELINSIGKE